MQNFTPLRDQLRDLIYRGAQGVGADVSLDEIEVGVPVNEEHGDYSCNIAMKLSGKMQKPPQLIAEELSVELRRLVGEGQSAVGLQEIRVAPPAFINFYLSPLTLVDALQQIVLLADGFGRNNNLAGQKVIVEYTDPNPFKAFHIGHLMSNAIGESLSRLVEFSGAEIKRANYQGDVGMHVAKSIYGLQTKLNAEGIDIFELEKWELEKRIEYMGQAYALGATKFEEDAEVKREIELLNKVIYDRSDKEIDQLYELGRKWSLDYFETIYEKLGTRFDFNFFEREVGSKGMEVVHEGLAKGVFEESDGAVIYRGENHGLHNRVFINSMGLPTYEAKDLGLAMTKHENYSYDRSLIITGNEINDYFHVILKAMEQLRPELAGHTTHIGHGMLRLKSGKMSSRTGQVITGESLLRDVIVKVTERSAEGKHEVPAEELTEELKKEAEQNTVAVAVGAVKYSILKNSPGKDIIFDFDQSLALEGNSGPYLQYTYARAQSVRRKARGAEPRGAESGDSQASLINAKGLTEHERRVLKWLVQFPEYVEDAAESLTPNTVAGYLFELAQGFNSFYNSEQVIGSVNEEFRLQLTAAVAQVIKNGLWLLGIKTVERM